MATKRPYVHPSRHGQVPDEPKRKRQKPDNLSGRRPFKKAHPINDLKSQVRSLKRLLEHHEDLPANVRVEKERALQSAEYELGEAQRAKKRSEMIARWHKVRFFDRQKANKRLKRAKRELNECLEGGGEESTRLTMQRKVHEAEVDVNYAVYYPLERHYVPLFPSRQKTGAAEDEGGADEEIETEVQRKGDLDMWRKIEECMGDGTLEELRNGKLLESNEDAALPPRGAEHSATKIKKKAAKENKLAGDVHGNRRERRLAAAAAKAEAEAEEESDGGFFE